MLQEQVRALTSQLDKAKHEFQTTAAEPSQETVLQQKAILERELMASIAKRMEAQVRCPVSVCSALRANAQRIV